MTLPVRSAATDRTGRRDTSRLRASSGCRRGLNRNRFLSVLLHLSRFADVDTALKESAILDADTLRDDIAGQRTFVADIYAIAGIKIAANFTEHDDFTGIDVG